MTEAEWLAATAPTPMLECLRAGASDRKLRLFACVCYRETFRYHPAAANGPISVLVAATEEFVDGRLTPVEWEAVRAGMPHSTFHPHSNASHAATAAVFDAGRHNRTTQDIDHFERAVQEQRLAAFLRDIFGNPFRPAVVDPNWLMSTVVAIARQVYESRDFSAMPILADALQDADCDNDEILNHCRQPGEHVRGCWVVDLILGKE